MSETNNFTTQTCFALYMSRSDYAKSK